MSKCPKRRAHVWHSMNGKKEVVMKSNNENEAPAVMAELCAIGFLIAFVLIFALGVFFVEGVLCALGVISDC